MKASFSLFLLLAISRQHSIRQKGETFQQVNISNDDGSMRRVYQIKRTPKVVQTFATMGQSTTPASSQAKSSSPIPSASVPVFAHRSSVAAQDNSIESKIWIMDGNSNFNPDDSNDVHGAGNIVNGIFNGVKGNFNILEQANHNNVNGNHNTIVKGDGNVVQGNGAFIQGSNNKVTTQMPTYSIDG